MQVYIYYISVDKIEIFLNVILYFIFEQKLHVSYMKSSIYKWNCEPSSINEKWFKKSKVFIFYPTLRPLYIKETYSSSKALILYIVL